MPSAISRLGRVALRVLRPLSWIPRVWRWVVLGLSALGVFAAAQQWWATDIQPWFRADPTHLWLAGVSILCAAALLALYGVEKEADASRLKGVKIEHHFVYQARWSERDKQLTVAIRLGFLNNSTLPTSVRVQQVQLQHKKKRFWKTLPFDFTRYIEHHGVVYEEALIPARQRDSRVFSLAGRALESAQCSFQSNRLKMILAIPGQPNEEVIVPLPTPQVIP